MQKIKRIVNKIGAISTGAALLGATMVGAMAADLSTYPDPFVMNGAANNVAIVHSASGLDSASAGYVLTGLAGAITATTGGAVTSVEGGYKLEKSGNKFNINNTAYDINTKLTKTEMPVVLKKGTFVDDEGDNTDEVEYSQQLKFTDRRANAEKSIHYIYDRNKERADKLLGDYIYLSKSTNAYAWEYEFNLDSAVTVANADDLESTKLELMGRLFTVSNVAFTTGNVTKLILLAGDVTQNVATGDTVNGVTLLSVDSNGNKCTVEYGGNTHTINDGSTKTMADGTIIGVTKVIPSNKESTPDYCELNIGADKVELEDNKKVKVNGDNIDGSKVQFGSRLGFDNFNVTFSPEERIYLAAGEEYEDPVFGAFKLIFGGVVEDDMTDVEFEAIDDEVKITAMNYDGDTTSWVAFCANNTGVANIKPCSDADEPVIYLEGDFVTNLSLGPDIEDLEDMGGYDIRFLYSREKVSRIVRIDSIDTDENKTSFYDETTGTAFEDQEFTYDGAGSTFDNVMPGAFILNFSLGYGTSAQPNDARIHFVDINDKGPIYYTKNEGNITFNMLWNETTPTTRISRQTASGVSGGLTAHNAVEFVEIDTGVESTTTGTANTDLRMISLNFTYDTTDKEIDIAGVTSEFMENSQTTLEQKDDSVDEIKAAKTLYGTYVEQLVPSTEGMDSVLIRYPASATYAEVWIAPTSATVSTATEEATGVDIKSETEVSDISTMNAIVVGGPAANSIAASLLGLTYPAIGDASGLAEGEAILKMVDNGANVALLAFGWEKDDTARAAKVLQSYGNYDLSGSEVSVGGSTGNPTVVTV